MNKKVLNPIEAILLVVIAIIMFVAGSYGHDVQADELKTLKTQIKQLNEEITKIKKEAGVKQVKVEAAVKVPEPVVVQPPRPKPVPPVRSYGSIVDTARAITIQFFGEAHWNAMAELIRRESNFNPNAVNPRSGACGIPQALPCSKMPDKSVEGQLVWMNNYVKARYGNPTNALHFHNRNNWY